MQGCDERAVVCAQEKVAAPKGFAWLWYNFPVELLI